METRRRFFYAPKAYGIDSNELLKWIMRRFYSLNPVCPKFFRISEYFDKSRIEFPRFCCIKIFPQMYEMKFDNRSYCTKVIELEPFTCAAPGGQGVRTPPPPPTHTHTLKNHKNVGFLCNTGSDPRYQATIQCWTIIGQLI